MDFGDLIPFINQSGFPVVVSLYTLIRLETAIKKNTEVIASMSEVITSMSTVLQMLVSKNNKGE